MTRLPRPLPPGCQGGHVHLEEYIWTMLDGRVHDAWGRHARLPDGCVARRDLDEASAKACHMIEEIGR